MTAKSDRLHRQLRDCSPLDVILKIEDEFTVGDVLALEADAERRGAALNVGETARADAWQRESESWRTACRVQQERADGLEARTDVAAHRKLEQDLAAMTAARDEACTAWESWVDTESNGESPQNKRIDELRAIGRKP